MIDANISETAITADLFFDITSGRLQTNRAWAQWLEECTDLATFDLINAEPEQLTMRATVTGSNLDDAVFNLEAVERAIEADLSALIIEGEQ